VLLSGLFWRGKPHAVIEQVRAGALSLIGSPGLLAELAEVMNRPKFEEIGAWLRSSTRHRYRQRSAAIPRTTRCRLSQSHRKPI
jgi:predicted nucleic acid-binding protein